MQNLKEYWLVTFRAQWKKALAMKFKDNPEKLKTVDMHELAEEWFGNDLIKQACATTGVTAKDIEDVLSSCRDELLKEARNV